MAAGSLETLLCNDGKYFFEKAKRIAKSNPRFLYALANVWLEEDDEIFDEYQQFLKECGLNSMQNIESLLDI